MNTIKRKIMVFTVMMVMMVGSMANAFGGEYWNGDTNYPRAYGKENVTWYVDLSSAYAVEAENHDITLKYNVITTYDDSDETRIGTYTIFLKSCEDGYDRYRVDNNGKKDKLSPQNGWQVVPYESSCLVTNHLRIKE